ncbi:protein cordon-bleu isoform X2 [Mugil cephalus]|nr:protein cordon-bleu isoform X2 [Mugil cephalus]
MKARAPPPPSAPQPAPRNIFRNTAPDGGGTDAKENILRPTVDVRLTLPQGQQVSVTEDGSKALMDLLVDLCSRYHLNPSLHTLELLSPEGHSLGFKPNALLGSLNVARVLIKEKVSEEKVARKPAPKQPEKTVRLMVNYHGSQKAVLRVNPLVPLQALIPVICDKCELDPAHVLLLKDSASRHELPLDKSLTDLGIKELYIHDYYLVLQPKMASAPALNYPESIQSSTTSLGRKGKKGFLGVFQFSRRKSKIETTGNMDDSDDYRIQNRGTQSSAMSTVSGVSSIEDRPTTLGQSQSVTTLPRMSPKADSKKKRAPAPPGTMTPGIGHATYESYQIGLGSESQQRKRKAPAPPPTPTSITQGSDDPSTSAAPSPVSHATELPTPALRSKAAQSTRVSSSTVVMQTVKSASRVYDTTPASSPTPSSSTTDSLAVQDSSSEFSHSLDESDNDVNQAGSQCSSLTSTSVSESVPGQPSAKSTSSRMKKTVSSKAAQINQEQTSDSSSRSKTESALNLKLDEVENNRHSAMGNTDRPVPPKPRRSPARELSQHVLPPKLSASPSSSLHTESSPPQNPMEVEEAAPQPWLHSMPSSAAKGQKPDEESLSTSSSGISLPDQGYATSEGMAEGTSPDGSLSLDGSTGVRRGKLLGSMRDCSSDSDEGCANWGSRHRHNDLREQSIRHHAVSVRETPYRMSTCINEVDTYVPVTAIDEVLEEYERKEQLDSHSRTESSSSKGFRPNSSMEPQNRNNNAYTAAVGNKRSSSHSKKSQSEEKKSGGDKNEKKVLETKVKEKIIAYTSVVKEDKQTWAGKSNVDIQKKGKSIKINPSPAKSTAQQTKPDFSPTNRRAVSTEKVEEIQKVYQNNSTPSSTTITQGKITHNATSRFGMKTFTVVPSKPSSVKPAAAEQPAHTSTSGAIKIDDQGNMVTAGISRDKAATSSQSEKEETPLLGKAKAFWSSNERQSAVTNSKGLTDKAKESTTGPRSAPTVVVETTQKTSNTDSFKTAQSVFSKSAERVQPKEAVKDAKEPVKTVKVVKKESVEVETKISASKNVQQPNNKPAFSPPVVTDAQRDMNFLKPSRRTSSQYVATVITKTSSGKPGSVSKLPEQPTSLKTETTGFQKSGHSVKVKSHHSSSPSLADNRENVSTSASTSLGSTLSLRYQEHTSESRRDFVEDIPDGKRLEKCVGSTKESSEMLKTETTKNKHIQSAGSIQMKVKAFNEGGAYQENIKHTRPRSPSPPTSSTLNSFKKPSTAPKTQVPTSSSKDMTKAGEHRTPDAKTLPSVNVSNTGVIPEPPALTVFGPVKKFKPVISKSVDKETSLHSSLMEAIQTGAGREKLKKVSVPGNQKKVSHVEEENERSALLAAIRAQSSGSKLRKTKSVAARELEMFRKVNSEEVESAGSSPSLPPTSIPCTSSLLTPPPPPPPPPPSAVGLPPPPPVLPQGKPNSVAQPNANTLMEAALAREAMLEAIRSGSAAERLKKIGPPKKTVRVNGRLGTIGR